MDAHLRNSELFAENSTASIGLSDSEKIRSQTMARLQREAQEFTAKNPRLIGDNIYVDGLDGQPSLYVEVRGTSTSVLKDIDLQSPNSIRTINAAQGQPTIYNADTETMGWAIDMSSSVEKNGSTNDSNYGWNSNLDLSTRLQGWADSARSSALYTATVLYDTKMRYGYMEAIHHSADNAVASINKLGPNNLDSVEKIARQASAFRDATRTATQNLLTPWGKKMSQMIEGTERVQFEDRVAYREGRLAENLKRAPSSFEVLRGVAAGSGYSNKWVTRAAQATRVLGPAVFAAEATMSAKRVIDASPNNRARVGVTEASGLVGGLLGGVGGALFGAAAVGFLVSNPAGWIVLAATTIGGGVGASYGGGWGRDLGGAGYNQYEQIDYRIKTN